MDPFQAQTDNLQKRIDRLKLLKYQEANRVMELTKKQLDKTMQRLQKQRDTSFQDQLDAVQHGLASQNGIVAQVNGTLEQAAAVKHEKKAQLYSEWDQQVLPQFAQPCTHTSATDTPYSCSVPFCHRQTVYQFERTHISKCAGHSCLLSPVKPAVIEGSPSVSRHSCSKSRHGVSACGQIYLYFGMSNVNAAELCKSAACLDLMTKPSQQIRLQCSV